MPQETPDARRRAEDFDIGTLELQGTLEGGEGLDANHASRLRMQFLASQHASMVTQVQFADAKAAALMTVVVLVALNGPARLGVGQVQDILGLLVLVVTISTVGFAMAALIPRYPTPDRARQVARRERFSWPSLVANGAEPMDHAEFMRSAEASQLVMSAAQANAAMAQVLQRKFQSIRIAFILGAVDLALIVAYVMVDRLI